MQDNVFEDIDTLLSGTAQLLDAEGLTQALKVLKTAQAKVEKTGYDNWDGGTNIYTLYLQIDPKLFTSLGTQREQIEVQVNERFKTILEQYSSDWVTVKIVPLVTKNPEWRSDVGEIPRGARQDILDIYRLNQLSWSGELDEVEFLERIFDLKSLPSTDSRYKDAARDIWQHRINNDDWEDAWVFGDKRFNLLDGPHETFLKFVCETIHPAVRKDRSIAVGLANEINKILETCGWELHEEEIVAGKNRYKFQKILTATKRAATRAKTVADALDAGWMHKEIIRLENAIDKDPSLAIGTAKELIETCCKSILNKLGIPVPGDFSSLTKETVKALKLVPEGIPDAAKGASVIKVILSNLITIPNQLAELRAMYGSGHGRDGQYRGLEVRHARLAVGAAVAFIDFVTETYHSKAIKEPSDQNNSPAQERPLAGNS